jgi:eukaryotic-like serine/threonine-protein kinase
MAAEIMEAYEDLRSDGKYRVLVQLGQGGTAVVTLAVARGPSGFSKLVVLKTMKDNLTNEADFAAMFMNEAKLTARLNHPNIVQIIEVFESKGVPTIVMEYLEGQPLSSVIARDRSEGVFSLPLHLRVISDALSGLEYAHELKDFDGRPLKVVHRDISPQNIFITFDGQVKVLDFGIAKLSWSQVETATGVIKGKLRYMPPEQIMAEGVDRRSDVFAVGIMLWEAATGKKMWHGLGEAAIMNRILDGEIPLPRSVAPGVDPELEAVIMRALAARKEDRYDSAAELQKALDGYLASIGARFRNQEIGQVIAELFSDVRERTNQVVQTQLAKIASLSAAEYAAVEPVELRLSDSGVGQMTPSTSLLKTPRRGLGAAVKVGIAALGVAAVLGFLLLRPAREPPATAASAKVKAGAPARAQLTISAYPSSARIFLDDEPLPNNPFVGSYPVDPLRKYQLRASAEGFEPELRELTIDQNTEIVLALRQSAKPAGPPSASASPRAAHRPAAVKRDPKPAPDKAASCQPPYYFDETGTKKWKVNCLR